MAGVHDGGLALWLDADLQAAEVVLRRERTLARPPIFRELDDEALYDKLAATVGDKEHEFQAELRAKGRRFMGLPKLAKQDWNRAAVSLGARPPPRPRPAPTGQLEFDFAA